MYMFKTPAEKARFENLHICIMDLTFFLYQEMVINPSRGYRTLEAVVTKEDVTFELKATYDPTAEFPWECEIEFDDILGHPVKEYELSRNELDEAWLTELSFDLLRHAIPPETLAVSGEDRKRSKGTTHEKASRTKTVR